MQSHLGSNRRTCALQEDMWVRSIIVKKTVLRHVAFDHPKVVHKLYPIIDRDTVRAI